MADENEEIIENQDFTVSSEGAKGSDSAGSGEDTSGSAGGGDDAAGGTDDTGSDEAGDAGEATNNNEADELKVMAAGAGPTANPGADTPKPSVKETEAEDDALSSDKPDDNSPEENDDLTTAVTSDVTAETVQPAAAFEASVEPQPQPEPQEQQFTQEVAAPTKPQVAETEEDLDAAQQELEEALQAEQAARDAMVDLVEAQQVDEPSPIEQQPDAPDASETQAEAGVEAEEPQIPADEAKDPTKLSLDQEPDELAASAGPVTAEAGAEAPVKAEVKAEPESDAAAPDEPKADTADNSPWDTAAEMQRERQGDPVIDGIEQKVEEVVAPIADVVDKPSPEAAEDLEKFEKLVAGDKEPTEPEMSADTDAATKKIEAMGTEPDAATKKLETMDAPEVDTTLPPLDVDEDTIAYDAAAPETVDVSDMIAPEAEATDDLDLSMPADGYESGLVDTATGSGGTTSGDSGDAAGSGDRANDDIVPDALKAAATVGAGLAAGGALNDTKEAKSEKPKKEKRSDTVRTAGEVDPDLTEEEKARRAKIHDDYLRDEAAKEQAEQAANSKEAGLSEGETTETDYKETLAARMHRLMAGVRDKGSHLRANINRKDPKEVEKKLRMLVLTAALKKGYKNITIYDSKDRVDHSLTAQAQDIYSKLASKGGPLEGMELSFGSKEPEKIPPWRKRRFIPGAQTLHTIGKKRRDKKSAKKKEKLIRKMGRQKSRYQQVNKKTGPKKESRASKPVNTEVKAKAPETKVSPKASAPSGGSTSTRHGRNHSAGSGSSRRKTASTSKVPSPSRSPASSRRAFGGAGKETSSRAPQKAPTRESSRPESDRGPNAGKPPTSESFSRANEGNTSAVSPSEARSTPSSSTTGPSPSEQMNAGGVDQIRRRRGDGASVSKSGKKNGSGSVANKPRRKDMAAPG